VLDNQNRLHMHSFVPLTRLEHTFIVQDGLKAGERILFEGTQKAHDGMIIKPLKPRPASLAIAR
jgi:membrane fusion protein (multidrug efflux system)